MLASGLSGIKALVKRFLNNVAYYTKQLAYHLDSPSVLYRRRRYFGSVLFPPPVPPHYLSFFPDGFSLRKLSQSGLAVIDNFCTAKEATDIMDAARPRLVPRGIVINNALVVSERRTSQTAVVFDEQFQDPSVVPLLFRGAALCGVPYHHAEAVYVTRYLAGEKFDAHMDCYPGYCGDRLYTVLIYLNDLAPDQGGETVFEALDVSIHPKTGRAISWVNKTPNGVVRENTLHASRPVADGAEKWVVQLWFRRYRMFDPQLALGAATAIAHAGGPDASDLLEIDGITPASATDQVAGVSGVGP